MSQPCQYVNEGDPYFFTIKEAAAEIRVSPQILYRAVRDNKLPAKKVGNRYRFKPADVRRFADTELEDA